jgi:pyruvate formate lyase activating enzyme
MTVDEVFQIAVRDMDFYRRTGGGVSIGGGEPTMQPQFTLALTRKLQEAGIHVALDTCGYVRSEIGMQCLKAADLLLFDVKGMEPEGHLRNTGVSNGLILENLKKMAAIRKPMIIRMPLVPGYNDSLENIQAAAELLGGMPSVERVDLMAYQHVRRHEIPAAGTAISAERCTADPEFMDEARALMERYGLKTQFGG